MAHQITVRSDARGVYTYTHTGTGITEAHPTDGLSRLCRRLVAFGARGAAEVRGDDGRLRYTVPAIERTAKRTLCEDDRRGLHWRTYRPRPETAPGMAA
ncbi:MAG: hypothetical protein QJR07_13675 [Acetobacteraceae bacterium]|nr:hypothetical protein [Acetobacteraceae bacterium]